MLCHAPAEFIRITCSRRDCEASPSTTNPQLDTPSAALMAITSLAIAPATSCRPLSLARMCTISFEAGNFDGGSSYTAKVKTTCEKRRTHAKAALALLCTTSEAQVMTPIVEGILWHGKPPPAERNGNCHGSQLAERSLGTARAKCWIGARWSAISSGTIWPIKRGGDRDL